MHHRCQIKQGDHISHLSGRQWLFCCRATTLIVRQPDCSINTTHMWHETSTGWIALKEHEAILLHFFLSLLSYLTGRFCPWTFSSNTGLNMFPLDSALSCLDYLLGYSTQRGGGGGLFEYWIEHVSFGLRSVMFRLSTRIFYSEGGWVGGVQALQLIVVVVIGAAQWPLAPVFWPYFGNLV